MVRLRVGDRIAFGPEHITRIENPPRGYLIQRFGRDFVT
jgi:hypothetical protein